MASLFPIKTAALFTIIEGEKNPPQENPQSINQQLPTCKGGGQELQQRCEWKGGKALESMKGSECKKNKKYKTEMLRWKNGKRRGVISSGKEMLVCTFFGKTLQHHCL